MSIGDWVVLVALIGSVATAWVTVQVKVATLDTRLKAMEGNHIPTLVEKIENLPCQHHLEQIVIHTTRMEAVMERLESMERRLNGEHDSSN